MNLTPDMGTDAIVFELKQRREVAIDVNSAEEAEQCQRDIALWMHGAGLTFTLPEGIDPSEPRTIRCRLTSEPYEEFANLAVELVDDAADVPGGHAIKVTVSNPDDLTAPPRTAVLSAYEAKALGLRLAKMGTGIELARRDPMDV